MRNTQKHISRYHHLAISLLLLVGSRVFAAETQSTMGLSAGYRLDNLDWNIAGTSAGTDPNVLSELEWRDMDIFQLKGELTSSNPRQIYFRGSAAYGWVMDGDNQDSDYAGDNRTLEFSRSINGVEGSTVMDISGGLGMEIYFGENNRHSLIPMVGYSFHAQRLRMTDGNQELWNGAYAQLIDPSLPDTVPLGPFSGLNSSYDASWWGPWIGMDVTWDLRDSGNAFARIEYHRVDFNAEANWNLRDDFAHPLSFEHEADGAGWIMELGWHKPSTNLRWVWGATISLQSWQTDPGVDRTYLVDPAPPCFGNCYSETRLNEVNWTSKSINLTLSRKINF